MSKEMRAQSVFFVCWLIAGRLKEKPLLANCDRNSARPSLSINRPVN